MNPKTKKISLILSTFFLTSIATAANYTAVVNLKNIATIGDGKPPVPACVGGELTRAQLDAEIAASNDVTLACVGTITDFSGLFAGYPNFNQDISAWDVSSGQNFSNMFSNQTAFNQDLSNWNTSSGTNFTSFLSSATMTPDADLSNLVLNGTTEYFFQSAKIDGKMNDVVLNSSHSKAYMFMFSSSSPTTEFNRWKIDGKNISNFDFVFMSSQLSGSFNDWTIDGMVDLTGIFQSTTLNQDANFNNWKINGGTLSSMYQGGTLKGNMNNWNLSEIERMDSGFQYLKAESTSSMDGWTISLSNTGSGNVESLLQGLNQDGSMDSWNILNFKSGDYLFQSINLDASATMDNWVITGHQSLPSFVEAGYSIELYGSALNWTISSVGDSSGLFYASTITSDITGWNLSDLTNYNEMFYDATFNQDISAWDVSNATSHVDFRGGTSNLSASNSPF